MLSSTYSDFQVFLHFFGSNKLNIAIFVVVNLSIVINEIILMGFTTNLFLIGLQTHFKEFSPTQTSNLQVIPWKTNKQQNSPHNQLNWDDVKDDCDYMRHKTQLNALSTILYFPIRHNALCLPPKFCINYCCGMLLGICRPPKSISQNRLCKIWGANRVHYGQLEKSELSQIHPFNYIQ